MKTDQRPSTRRRNESPSLGQSKLLSLFRSANEGAEPDWSTLLAESDDAAITTPNVDLAELTHRFRRHSVPDTPLSIQQYYDFLRENVSPYVINTASPTFIGHMTSKIPAFTQALAALAFALNQNVVKTETSKAMTLLERETIAMLHSAFFQQAKAFYGKLAQDGQRCLGLITSGGTVANLAALWCARNRALPPRRNSAGADTDGFARALAAHGYQGAVLMGSKYLHYSVEKAASILGIGTNNVIYVAQSADGRIRLDALRRRMETCRRRKIVVVAIIGVAGATETGCIDPLRGMADIAAEFGVHFHVDASWGGPVIFSSTHKDKLDGIEMADSISLCGHKQLYLPVGVSVCLFRDPELAKNISTTAHYQARETGIDLGRFSPEGSRPGLSLVLHGALNIIGRRGYEQLIDHGIDNARYMAARIRARAEFELIGEPVLNLITYRYIPSRYRDKLRDGRLTAADNGRIDRFNVHLQERQFALGSTFTSRTTLFHPRGGGKTGIVVLRAVLANPLTSRADIDAAIEDQLRIAKTLRAPTGMSDGT